MVGTVGGILGDAGVNIAGMQVARDAKGGARAGRALGRLGIPAETLAEIEAAIDAASVRAVDLADTGRRRQATITPVRRRGRAPAAGVGRTASPAPRRRRAGARPRVELVARGGSTGSARSGRGRPRPRTPGPAATITPRALGLGGDRGRAAAAGSSHHRASPPVGQPEAPRRAAARATAAASGVALLAQPGAVVAPAPRRRRPAAGSARAARSPGRRGRGATRACGEPRPSPACGARIQPSRRPPQKRLLALPIVIASGRVRRERARHRLARRARAPGAPRRRRRPCRVRRRRGGVAPRAASSLISCPVGFWKSGIR